MGARARIELAVAALVAAAVAAYAISDNDLADAVFYLTPLVVASVLAWVGAERGPRERRTVGRLIAAGVTLTALGDLVWEVLDARGPTPDVSMADPLYTLAYVALCGALLVVLRRSSAGGDDLAFAIDAATIVVVSVLIFWSTAIDEIVGDASLTPQLKLVFATYPILDAVLLALVVRVFTSRQARNAIDTPFAAGVCLWLAADFIYLQMPMGGLELVMDAAWMIAPVLMARATWLAAKPVVDLRTPNRRRRIAQLGVAVFPLVVPPLLEFVSDMRGEPHQPTLLLVGSTLLTVLAFARMALLIRAEERALVELEIARDAALDASRAKSMFLATMSHEIRTPLTMVLGAGELLEDTELDEFQLGLVKRMRRSGRLLSTLVDGVLDFSRIEAGQLEIVRRPFDLHGLVDDLAAVYAPRASESGIGFDCHLDPDLPRRVVGDPDRLLQVLSNLLDNAVKFTSDGAVGLVVGTTADGRVEFVVSDSGIGIPQEDLGTVFDTFHQVDGSITRRYGGSGLGLAICKQLVELMGGTLSVTSEVGLGSAFAARVPLPVDPAAPPVGDAAPEPVLAELAAPEPASAATGLRPTADAP